MTYHIYSKYLRLAFPFPFATVEAAADHLATLPNHDNYGIVEQGVRTECEGQKIEREESEFESNAKERADELVRSVERSEDWKWGS